MTSFAADLVIWALLAGAAGFFLLGFVGLLIFPDIRSRLFTASRATLIGASLAMVAAILFGISAYAAGGGDIYATLVIHTLFLYGILAVGNVFVSRIILEQVPAPACLPEEAAAAAE